MKTTTVTLNGRAHTVNAVITRIGQGKSLKFDHTAYLVHADGSETRLGTVASAVYPKAKLEAEITALVAKRKRARMILDAPERPAAAAQPVAQTVTTTATAAPARLTGYKTQRVPTTCAKPRAYPVRTTEPGNRPASEIIADYHTALAAANLKAVTEPELVQLAVRASGAIRYEVRAKVIAV